jgi:hypothetical protein
MRAYFLRTLAAAAIYITLHFCVCLFVPSPIAAEYWVREMLVVKSRLAESIPSPRIIFIGGSSVLIGIDAVEVEKETGTPTMNMGLHAAIRLDRILQIGEQMARPGDIFVLSLEHSFYSCDQKYWNDWQVRNALAWDREYFNSFPVETRVKAIYSSGEPFLMLDILASKAARVFRPKIYASRMQALAPPEEIWARYQSGELRNSKEVYSAYKVDDHGDWQGISTERFSGPGVLADEPSDICPEELALLTAFVSRMKDKGVRVIFAHTPYLVDGARAEGWQEAEARFSRSVAITGAELLDRREELFFPREDFFNTKLHLNENGRRKWTNSIVANLRRLGVGKAKGDKQVSANCKPAGGR